MIHKCQSVHAIIATDSNWRAHCVSRGLWPLLTEEPGDQSTIFVLTFFGWKKNQAQGLTMNYTTDSEWFFIQRIWEEFMDPSAKLLHINSQSRWMNWIPMASSPSPGHHGSFSPAVSHLLPSSKLGFAFQTPGKDDFKKSLKILP